MDNSFTTTLISGALLGLVVAATFALGVVVGARRYWPFKSLHLLAQRMRRRWPSGRAAAQLRPMPDESDFEALELGTLLDRRRALGEFIWRGDAPGCDVLPDEVRERLNDHPYRDLQVHNVDRLTVRMRFGVDSIAYLFHPRRPTGRLMIYHEGHDGDFALGRHTIAAFLARGLSVLAFAMPLKGMNSRPFVLLRRLGRVQLADHDYLRFLDAEYDDFCAISLFLRPVIAGINHAATLGLVDCAMTGISGGGWTTTLCAALDDRIVASYPVAGSLPFFLREAGELSDYENHLPSLYNLVTYLELYVLGAFGPHRRQLQILNRYDTVVWPGTRARAYEARVQDALAQMGGGTFRVMVDDTHVGHKISKRALKAVLQDQQC